MTDPLTVTKAQALAKQMHDGGWSVYAIRDYLERRGVKRSWQTVKRWTNEHFAEQDRQRDRDRMRALCAERSGGRLAGHRRHTPQFRAVRLRALKEAGLSCEAIAKVMRLDFGDDLTRSQVDYALKTGRYPNLEPRKVPA